MSNQLASYRYRDSGSDWMGQVPDHWQLLPVKRFFRLVSEPAENNNDHELLSIYTDIGVRPRKELEQKGNRASTTDGYWLVKKGDLIVNKLLAWMGAIGMSNYDGVTSPAYDILRQTKPLDPKFYHYMFRCGICFTEFRKYSRGIMDMRLRLYFDELGKIPMPFPSKEEQTQIVEFLDYETAKIDALIEKQQQLIALLGEKRQAVISHAVTKGLNPDAPMRDSGVEWLGEVPEHWEITEFRRLIAPGTTITYGIVQAGPDIEGGIPYIRTSDMSGTKLPETGFLRTSTAIDESYARSRVATGDLIVAIRASLGKGLLTPSFLEGANLTQGTAKISPGEKLTSQFLQWAFNSPFCQTQIRAVAKGTTFLEITLTQLRRISIALPPPDEQRSIADHLEGKVTKMDALILNANSVIVLLQERRTALISAAVTGKIDVRGWKLPSADSQLETETEVA